MVNRPPVMIGFAGTHHTGKTTIARRVEMELRAVGLTVTRTGGLARRAAELGFPKMQRHTAHSTEWIIAASAAAALEASHTADVVLVDRTPHDALAYYIAAQHHRGEQPEDDEVQPLAGLADLHARHHALLLATVLDPSIPLGEHPRKDPAYLDTDYRAAVDRHLHELLADRMLHHMPVPSTGHDAAVQAAVTAALQAADA
ncbi:hypothetical protein GCM10010193_57310 [Kitasatospora atroaurantiaca]|uniref:AAA domain-containing protein n=1 Tax=Kitasatospora atroaurantiaca TaxID=285545 RepID=A0A561EN31_9ACTN|nr:AAA family ATPase [Kitasatospora atroaurantiaca]TWE16979.1 AAA domain-containing protein [Kitasatospora atroaurantiaca]